LTASPAAARTQVKICGICDAMSAIAAVDAGADLIGFHFCNSPRRVSPEEAKAIIDNLSSRPLVAGVFIDQDPAEVADVARFCELDLVQLHGSEPPGFDAGAPVMKVLKVRDGTLPDAEGWPDPIMLDSWSSDQRGGTGRSWDWRLARPLLERRRVFIAGGLNPVNVSEVVRAYRPYGVDVSSGVERRIRVKDSGLVHAFIRAVREADEQG
jgi:phosphoribosylanthranilate isomerase